ncbi:MAG: prepilin peptidase [Gemmatimonadaceae bacterium]
MFGRAPADVVAAALFVLLLIAACASDVRTRRVPNPLVAVLATTGLLYSLASDPLIPGLLFGLGGLLLGLAIWLPSWLLRLLGAGDVKLFAAAGAWLGPRATLQAAILAGVVGGVLSLVWMLRYRGARGLLLTLTTARYNPKGLVQPRPAESAPHHLPYTIALATGAIIVAWFPRILF